MITWSKCGATIRIDGSVLGKDVQNSYESDVYVQLNKVSMAQTSWAVFNAIHGASLRRGKKVTIVPFEQEGDNAYAVAVGGKIEGGDAAPRGVKPYAGGPDDVRTYDDEREMKQWFAGTGKGSDVEIHYNPHPPAGPLSSCPDDGRKWKDGCPLYEGADHAKDDQLFHELVHTVRQTRGEFNCVPTSDKDWMNEEEFLAVLVTNIYLSERGKTNLRGNYLGFGLLTAPLNTSEGFLGNGTIPVSPQHLEHRRLVNKLVTDDWGMCDYISHKVNAGFNPIREYLRNSGRYPHDPREANRRK